MPISRATCLRPKPALILAAFAKLPNVSDCSAIPVVLHDDGVDDKSTPVTLQAQNSNGSNRRNLSLIWVLDPQITWSDDLKMLAIRREFIVEVPAKAAWEHLCQIERWPSWARHIKRVEVIPAGELGAKSKGVIHLRNGVKSEFTMTEFNPYRNWKWVGPFLWLTIYYDHVFEALDGGRTKLTWIVEAEGFGVAVLGRLFAKVYNGNLDKAIPLLIGEINAGTLRSSRG